MTLELLARVLLSSMFLYASVVNPFNKVAMKALMKAKNMPFIDILFPASMIFMFFSSLAIIFNIYLQIACLYLIVFMVIATYYFADFWNSAEREKDMKLNQFTANVTIIGGLLLLYLKG
jgi:putative oxidoreductase